MAHAQQRLLMRDKLSWNQSPLYQRKIRFVHRLLFQSIARKRALQIWTAFCKPAGIHIAPSKNRLWDFYCSIQLTFWPFFQVTYAFCKDFIKTLLILCKGEDSVSLRFPLITKPRYLCGQHSGSCHIYVGHPRYRIYLRQGGMGAAIPSHLGIPIP